MDTRPRIFKTPQDITGPLDKYFAETEIQTMSGIALALKCSRETVCRWIRGDNDNYPKEIVDIIRRYKLKIMDRIERNTIDPNTKNAQGNMFMLMNMEPTHYKSKHEIHNTNTVTLDISDKLHEIMGNQQQDVIDITPTET